MLARTPARVTIYPFILHTIVMALFSSLIAPFGGFFASGFKRAFKIKVDFCYFFLNCKFPQTHRISATLFLATVALWTGSIVNY